MTLPTSSVVTVVTTGMKLQLCLFFALAKSKIKLFIAHEFVMSNYKTHKSQETLQLDKARLKLKVISDS